MINDCHDTTKEVLKMISTLKFKPNNNINKIHKNNYSFHEVPFHIPKSLFNTHCRSLAEEKCPLHSV